jgi:hypothetical protein
VTQGPSLTTDQLLDAGEQRTGLARNQLIVLAAKSATVRHLADHPKYQDQFVLKGGTLLSNVYKSPRQSIADADYTYLDRENLDLPELEEALATDGTYGFDLHPEDGQWTTENDLYEGSTPFSIEGIEITSRRKADRELKISVSVRPGEWLDPGPKLMYTDQLLAEDAIFWVNGLSKEELSAEKILGWCSKPLPKHLVDLACVARDHGDLDLGKVADLLARKFQEEGDSPRYAGAGINGLPDLARVFLSETKVEELRGTWSTFVDAELLLLPGELAMGDEETLSRVENVERLAAELWMPFLEDLS